MKTPLCCTAFPVLSEPQQSNYYCPQSSHKNVVNCKWPPPAAHGWEDVPHIPKEELASA